MYSHNKEIINYYDYCDIDYKITWRDKESLGMHFGFWDKSTKSHKESLLNQNKKLAELAKINSEDIILDAGCGVGGTSIWLAKNFNAKVHSISLSKKQINLAKEYSIKSNMQHLTNFSVQDYNKTSFSSEMFTVLWAQESVPNALDKKAFLKESYRLLKKRGRLVIADYFLSKKKQNPTESGILDKWMKGWAMSNLMLPQDFIKIAKEVGFKKIKHYNTSILIKPSFKRLLRLSYLAYPIEKISELLKIRNQYHAGNMRSVHYGYKALKMGLWQHGLVYAEK